MARVATLNFHWDTTNFGAVITAYALNRVLSTLGHQVRSLDFKPDLPRVRKKPENPAFDRFRRENIPLTDVIRTPDDVRLANAEHDAFVVGSDQVWNPHIAGWYPDFYFLSFVDPRKRRISAAASFGCVPTEKFSPRFLRETLGCFDGLSVREEAAAQDLRRIGLEPTVLPDPVFGLTRADWQCVADRSPVAHDGHEVVWYSVNKSEVPKIESFLKRHGGELGDRVVHLAAPDGIENWLQGIAQASFVVTDSFHATCFAILFRRPFVVFVPGDAKAERMRGLLRRLRIPGRIYVRPKDAPSSAELAKPIDYAFAEGELDRMRLEVSDYFRRALEDVSAARPETVARRVRALDAMRRRVFRRLILLSGHMVFLAGKFLLLRFAVRSAADRAKRLFRMRREELKGWSGILPRLGTYRLDARRGRLSRSISAYAVMASDEVRSVSTSGGVFSLLAERFIADGGLVAGASFDGSLACAYELVGDRAGIGRLRGTKYVKARLTKAFFAAMEEALRSGRRVLVVGIPCQLAAIAKRFSAFREQLFLVDLICAGAPAQDWFLRYVDENWGRGNVAAYEFRSKVRGWRHRHNLIRVVLRDGHELYRTKREDEFRTAMGLRYVQDEGCFSCPFARPTRVGDLTIGDFWGVPTSCDDGKGTSAVLVNTGRGESLVDGLSRDRTRLLRKIDPELVFYRQPALVAPAHRSPGREAFLRCARTMTVRAALESARKLERRPSWRTRLLHLLGRSSND